MSLDAVVEKYLGSEGQLPLLELVQSLEGGSVHQLIQRIVTEANQQQIDVAPLLYINQPQQVKAQLEAQAEATLSAEQLVEQLCQRLSMLQTGGIVGKYCSTKSFHQQIPTAADVVMLGDSITEWAQWHELFPEIMIINRGISGDITAGMLGRLDSVIAAGPEKVFLMAGINDLSLGFALEQVIDNYHTMVERLLAEGIQVVVQSTLYVGERLANLNPLIRQLNQALRSLCDDHQLYFVDLNQRLAPDGQLASCYSFDDLHLNGAAYQVWQQTLSPLLLTAR